MGGWFADSAEPRAMPFLDVVFDIVDLFATWRVWLCVGPAILAAYYLHDSFPGAIWPWFLSVPLVVAAFVAGWKWQWRSSQHRYLD